MPFQLNQSTNAPTPVSLSLLAEIHPTISLKIHNKCKFNPTRILQLRDSTIILFKSEPLSDLSNAIHTIPITSRHIPKRKNPKTVTLSTYAFKFFSMKDATLFELEVTAVLFSLSQSYSSFQSVPCSLPNKSTLLDDPSTPPAFSSDRSNSDLSSASVSSSLIQLAKPFNVKRIKKDDAFFTSTHLSKVVQERVVLELVSNSNTPFSSRMTQAYETKDSLNLVTEAPELGNLLQLVSNLPKQRLSESFARIIFAELLLAIEDLHNLGILFRGATPHNVYLTSNGHVKLCDFGFAKRIYSTENFRSSVDSSTSTISSSSSASPPRSTHMSSNFSDDDDLKSRNLGRTKSFIGRRTYMAPENVNGNESYGMPVDIWSLGITLYTLITGRHPFQSSLNNSIQLFQKIANDNIRYPKFISQELKTLLKGLLDKDETTRLTTDEIKQSEWLRDIDWYELRTNAERNIPNNQLLQLIQNFQLLNNVDDDSSNSSSFNYFNLSEDEDSEKPSSAKRNWNSSTRSTFSLPLSVKKMANSTSSKPKYSSPCSKQKFSDEPNSRLLGFDFYLQTI